MGGRTGFGMPRSPDIVGVDGGCGFVVQAVDLVLVGASDTNLRVSSKRSICRFARRVLSFSDVTNSQHQAI